MRNHILSIGVIILSILLLVACGEKKKESQTDMDHEGHDHVIETTEGALAHEGVINVEAIDVNNDDKVFECPMDWNVLGDEAGSCPKCGMDLKEYSISDVKKNLDKFGYKYNEEIK